MKKSRWFDILVNYKFALAFITLISLSASLYPYILYDEAIWSYIGELWNERYIPPYIDSVENKTPGIFILYAIANSFGDYNIISLRALGVIFTISTGVLLYKISVKLLNTFTGVISIYVFGLMSCWIILDGYAFAYTEVFMIFFTTLSFYFLIQNKDDLNQFRALYFSGLSLGLAITFKQIAFASVLGFMTLYVMINQNSFIKYKIKSLLYLALGITTIILLSYFILYIYDVSFLEYIEGAWLILFNSGSNVGGFEAHLDNFFKLFFTSRLVLIFPFILFFILKRKLLSREVYLLVIVWFIFDFIGANASGYYYGHQIKQLLPSIALIIGVLITILIKNQNRIITIILLILILFPYKQVYINMKSIKEEYTRTIGYSPVDEASNWIKSNSNDDDFVYVLGADQELIFVLSKISRRSSSKYINSIFIKNQQQRELILKDVMLNIPRFILKHNSFSKVESIYGNQLANYFSDNYELINTISDIEIYQKRN